MEQAAAARQVSVRRMYKLFDEPNPPPRRSDGKFPCFEFGQWVINPKSIIVKDFIYTESMLAYVRENPGSAKKWPSDGKDRYSI